MGIYLIEINNPLLNQKVSYLYNSQRSSRNFEAYKFQKGSETIFLTNNGSNRSSQLEQTPAMVFQYIIERKFGVHTEEIYNHFNLSKENLSTIISKITRVIKDINHSDLNDFNQYLSSDLLFKRKNQEIYFSHVSTPLGIVDKSKIKEFDKNQYFESLVTNKQLIITLLEKSELLSKMLYQTTAGDFLPFIQLPNTIKFPLFLNNEIDSVKHDWVDSYKGQREGLGAKLYDGKNFRALNIKNQYLTIGQSSYFQVLDSADYVSSRLKLYYYKEESAHFQRIFDIWSERLKNIKEKQIFESYNSGIAFSIPIFQICEDGSLKVLAAQGSQTKATGSGRRHVAPAGMFEIFSVDYQDNHQFTFEDFKILCIKELFEETVFGKEKLEFNCDHPFSDILEPFLNTEFLKVKRQDKLPFKTLADYIKMIHDHWDEIWQSFGKEAPHHAALSALLTMTESEYEQNSFFVLDFANLRPEFIVPLYISEPLSTIVNWEYEQDNQNVEKDILSFKNLDDLNNWAKNDINEYCAPALAAIYLGAKQFFMKNK